VAITATAGNATQTCTDNTTSIQSTWTLCTVPFVALSTSTAITLVGSAGVNYIGLDNVTVESSTTAPEPSTMILLGAGFAGLVSRRLRRR
jgi:monoamine oxidase